MLCKVKALKGYKLNAIDGEIGSVNEFYFDDHHWTVRYLVADTGNWLMGRQVLISPYSLIEVNILGENISVNLTKKQIEDSPSLETDKPVSKQFEEKYYGYYGWPIYWDGPYAWGYYPNIVRDSKNMKAVAPYSETWDSHLRSTRAVSGHNIQASDGEIGHVDDFVIDDTTWTIRYIIIDTQNWLPGKKVLISPQWIKRISWDESKVFVSLLRDTIRQAPEYTEDCLLTRDYEAGLHHHYDRQGYWISEPDPMRDAL